MPVLPGGVRLPPGPLPEPGAAGGVRPGLRPGLRISGDDPQFPVYQRLPGAGGSVRRPGGLLREEPCEPVPAFPPGGQLLHGADAAAAKGRKAGLTFAPEAGTQRLRDAINKNVTEEELTESLKTAFSGGWSSVKLYFMLGLPTETDEDVLGIAEMANHAVHTWREHASNKNRGLRLTVSTSWFVPKPFTAFQWEAQISRAEYERRVKLLRRPSPPRRSTTTGTTGTPASWRRCWPGETGGWAGCWRRPSGRGRVWTPGATISTSAAGWRPSGSAAWTRRSTPAGSGAGGGPPLEHDQLPCIRRLSLAAAELAYQSVTTPDCRTRCSGCGANIVEGGECYRG